MAPAEAFTAYGLNGALLGTATALFPGMMQVSFPAQIHSVRLYGGEYAFDDFQFEGLAVPAPASALFLLGAAVVANRRRRD